MAEYKVVNATQLDADLGSLADSIRAKAGVTDKLTFPAGMKSAVDGIETGGGGDTSNEDALIMRNIAEYTNDRVTYIGNYAFRSFSNIVSVNFPMVDRICYGAFSLCTSLTTVDFPMVTRIENYAFSQCTSLTTGDFPMLEIILNSAFSNCTNFTQLILRSTAMVTLVNTDVFIGSPIISGAGYIYVPSALVDSYKTANNWSAYANQFRALEDYTIDGTTTGELEPDKI